MTEKMKRNERARLFSPQHAGQCQGTDAEKARCLVEGASGKNKENE